MSYLVAAGTITITTMSNGQILLSGSGGGSSVPPTTGFADVSASYVTIGNTGSLPNERSLAAGTGLTLTDGGANSAATFAINNNVVATLTGSVFTGVVSASAGLSGSIQRVGPGLSYLVAGNLIAITSQSNGQIVIASTASTTDVSASYITIGNTGSLPNERSLTAGTGLTLTDGGANSTATFAINNSVVATLTGSVFTGVVSASAGLSGSLQRVGPGLPYLLASGAITTTTMSNGQVIISAPPGVFARLDCFGHSYIDVNPGPLATNTNTSNDFSFVHIFGRSIGLPKELLTNHGINGAQLINNSRSGGGFARILQEIRHPNGTQPTSRNGGAYLFCYGINDIGNQTSANQSKVRADFGRCLTAAISKARAPDIYLAATSAQWAFGANFSTDAATAADWTSGVQTSKSATVVDSAGTSTATFTIPLGYMGEPICFNLVALSGGTLIVTWGGTVTGTTSIVGRTDTLSALSINAQCAYPVRFTAATNGLSAANAGQTITVRITTVTASTFTVDGCWIEAFKPAPVLVCNVPRLACHTYNVAFGDGVTTGVNTSFTSATAAFSSVSDAGQAITETDAQGAFTGGKTVASVTNATTIVLSANAAAAKTSIQVTLARIINGYTNYSTNTNFSGSAIPTSHAAADTDVDNMNTQIATTVSQFGSMVQIVDLNNALGNGDQNLPSTIFSWFNVQGLHPNDVGAARMAFYTYRAAMLLSAENDKQDLGAVEMASSVGPYPGPDRRLLTTSQIYTAEYTAFSTYNSVAGDMFAIPFFVTEGSVQPAVTQIELTNTPTAGSTIRIGWYDDINNTGYPQNLKQEVTALTVSTTTGIRNAGSFFNRGMQYGLHWLVIKMDTIVATAPILRSLLGPNRYLPNWTTATGGTVPIAWKLTGQGAGALPNIFPAGAALTNNAPALGITLTIQ